MRGIGIVQQIDKPDSVVVALKYESKRLIIHCLSFYR